MSQESLKTPPTDISRLVVLYHVYNARLSRWGTGQRNRAEHTEKRKVDRAVTFTYNDSK